jgi:hypothetical protein
VVGDIAPVSRVDREHTVTTEEFVEFWKWMQARWPSVSGKTKAEQRAYWEQLGKFDVAHVKSALDLCVRSDPAFPPGCMTLDKVAQELALADVTRRRALPEPKVDGAESLRTVVERQSGLPPSRVHLSLGEWVGAVFHRKGEA